MTDVPATLHEALAQLQTNLPHIGKDKTARVTSQRTGKTHTYDYVGLATISAKILPLLGELGLSFITRPTLREEGNFVLAYDLMHVSGTNLAGYYPLPQTGTPQEIGSAITYARRYCLCAVTGIAPDDDDDDAQAAEAAAKKAARGTPPQRAAGNLPANRDGSTARSKVTDDELAATGQMTDAELRAHNRLERDVKGTGPQGAQRLTATPEDDEFYLTPVRTPQAAPSKAQAIVMHFDRLKFTDRDERLKATSAIIGRQVTSTNDLTAAEGIEVANLLGKCRNRDALIEHLAVKAGEDTA